MKEIQELRARIKSTTEEIETAPVVDFYQMQVQYNLIKQGIMNKAAGTGFKIYDMKNGLIRIDVKA